MTEPGLVIVDKPAGWTSHDVVGRLRRLAGTRKVGHAGTLDPMATGVLVVGVERATRLLTFLVGADKEYTATIRLGASTPTDDAEGDVTARSDTSALTDEAVVEAAAELTGLLQQIPSTVSAIKVDGQRAYARARAGEQVELAARAVTVYRFEVRDVRRMVIDGVPQLDLDVDVVCSTGTYVRALARDLGAALGVGGYLTALRRSRVGPFGLDRAHTLDELAEDFQALPLGDAVQELMPVRRVSEDESDRLGYGQRLAPHEGSTGLVAAISPAGELIAILEETPGAAIPKMVVKAH